MDFSGDRINLTERECDAMEYADGRPAGSWPLVYLNQIEEMVRERILDKQSRVDEIRASGKLAVESAKLFELRQDISVLENAHDQILEYATSRGFTL